MAYFRVQHALGAILCLAAVAPACGGSSDSSATAVPLEDAPAKLAAALCEVEEQCLGTAFTIFTRGVDCATQLTTEINEGDFSLFETAMKDGKVSYDGTLLEACAKAIRDASCDVLTTRLATLCPDLVSGTIASGDDCTFDAECKQGLFCKTSGTCPGTCSPRLTAGQTCTQDDDCDSGLQCYKATKKCVKPAGKGEACEGPSDPPCSAQWACKGKTETEAGTCTDIDSAFSVAEGDPCDLNAGDFCKEGLSCALTGVGAGNSPVFTCEKAATGSTCHVGYPETCPEGQFCTLDGTSVDGKCVALPADGEACGKQSPNDTPSICATNTICDDGGTCRKKQHLGGKCSTDDECYSKHCEDGGCAPSVCAK